MKITNEEIVCEKCGSVGKILVECIVSVKRYDRADYNIDIMGEEDDQIDVSDEYIVSTGELDYGYDSEYTAVYVCDCCDEEVDMRECLLLTARNKRIAELAGI